MTSMPIPGAGTAQMSSPMEGASQAINLSNQWGEMGDLSPIAAQMTDKLNAGQQQAGLMGLLNGGGAPGMMAQLINGMGGQKAPGNSQFMPSQPTPQQPIMAPQTQTAGVNPLAGWGATPGGFGSPTMGYGRLASGGGGVV